MKRRLYFNSLIVQALKDAIIQTHTHTHTHTHSLSLSLSLPPSPLPKIDAYKEVIIYKTASFIMYTTTLTLVSPSGINQNTKLNKLQTFLSPEESHIPLPHSAFF